MKSRDSHLPLLSALSFVGRLKLVVLKLLACFIESLALFEQRHDLLLGFVNLFRRREDFFFTGLGNGDNPVAVADHDVARHYAGASDIDRRPVSGPIQFRPAAKDRPDAVRASRGPGARVDLATSEGSPDAQGKVLKEAKTEKSTPVGRPNVVVRGR